MAVQVLSVMFLFYTLYVTLFLLSDTGLYTIVWHRSILADFQNRARYNKAYQSNPEYADLEDAVSRENDALDSDTKTLALKTFDRQKPRWYGRSYLHLDSNYTDCTDLKKAVAIPNTQMGKETILQQVLADHTLNYFRCVLIHQLSPNP
jgi:hypothetical protein